MRLDRDMAATTATFLPAAFAASMQDLARTVVSARFAYTLEDTMTAGMRLLGFNSDSETTEPTSIGKPYN